MTATIRPRPESEINPRIEEALRYVVAIGAVLVLLLPAARGYHAQLGWLPLWLLAMPVTAWWALRRFRLPTRATKVNATPMPARPRRVGAQARRRARPARRVGLPQAA